MMFLIFFYWDSPPPFSIVNKINGDDFNTKSCITQSFLKHIILSTYWQIGMVFNFDLANDLLAPQLSPQGCTNQDVSDMSTI